VILLKKVEGGITVPDGFKSAGIACGIKESNNRDLALILSENAAEVAAVFTGNQVKAAPVLLSQKRVKDNKCKAVIVNSGNANACTGEKGKINTEKMTEAVARKFNLPVEQVLVASTGIIGQQLPMDKIKKGIEKLKLEFSDNRIKNSDLEAAKAILTTDNQVKRAAYSFRLPVRKKEVKIGGMVKGSGMIHPDMATMLGFITTDIDIDKKLLQEALKKAADISFNRISVDGDQSTNDSVFLLAGKKALENKIIKKDQDYHTFLKVLKQLSQKLAQQIVKDGEGATKFINIHVIDARTESQAEKVAGAVANSNLVKTACFGSDPNWGRILAAIGNSRTEINPKQLYVKINGKKLYEDGVAVNVSRKGLKGLMEDKNIDIEISLKSGDNNIEFWTTDLSYDYVKINAEYHT